MKTLELMFMKHYAPNRCLYIKVAKLRTGVGSAEMSHLQIAVSKYILIEHWGGGRVGGVSMDVNEELKFLWKLKIKKKSVFFFFFGGGGGRVRGGGSVGGSG